MTSQVYVVDVREGGPFRISLTYDTPNGTGKTTVPKPLNFEYLSILRLSPETLRVAAGQRGAEGGPI